MAVPDNQANLRLHPDEDLRRRDGVVFQCKFEGTYSVAEPKGLPVVQKACEKMREGKARRKESGVKQAPMVTVHISVQGVEVYSGEEVVTKTHMMKVPIEKISYIARDPSDRHYLAIIYETSPPKPADKPEFECTLFKHDINKTRDMVLTLNQAFDLAYEMRIKEGKIPKVSLKEQVDIYRSRLKQMSELLPTDKLTDFLRLLNITEVTEIRGLDAVEKGNAPHTMVTQPSVDVSTPSAALKAPTPPAAAAAASTTPAKPLLQTAAAAAAPAASQPQMILDFDAGQSWAPVNQQQPPLPTRPAPNPFGGSGVQQQQQQPSGFNSDSIFGAPFVPTPATSAAPLAAPPTAASQAQQDLMRLGFGPLDADFEFDPLKMN